jgi:hypothetical protein
VGALIYRTASPPVRNRAIGKLSGHSQAADARKLRRRPGAAATMRAAWPNLLWARGREWTAEIAEGAPPVRQTLTPRPPAGKISGSTGRTIPGHALDLKKVGQAEKVGMKNFLGEVTLVRC